MRKKLSKAKSTKYKYTKIISITRNADISTKIIIYKMLHIN